MQTGFVLGSLVVIVLAIGPKVRGSSPAENEGFLGRYKSAKQLTSERN
jgi:hypothetical protein